MREDENDVLGKLARPGAAHPTPHFRGPALQGLAEFGWFARGQATLPLRCSFTLIKTFHGPRRIR